LNVVHHLLVSSESPSNSSSNVRWTFPGTGIEGVGAADATRQRAKELTATIATLCDRMVEIVPDLG